MKNLIKILCIFVMLNPINITSKNNPPKNIKIDSGIKTPEINDFEEITIIKTKNKKEKNMKIEEYKIKQEIKPASLSGISDNQINDHWKLYEGYVKQVNSLNAELQKMAQDGKVNELIYSDRRRRYGFEYNGMILHEYYFGNLSAASQKLSDPDLIKAIEEAWGSFDKWKEDFIATGKTRSIGWAILYMDPQTKKLTNHFIAEHQDGIISGFKPILVMDVWEHAYMVDHSATDRAKYIDAFLQNVDWSTVEERFNK
ncbi:MAG: Superoxide dismutase [Mn] [uncultured bacterium]|nr:MAG: Superoxide dismutase [Mn] [uncultured bacterium]